MKYKKLVTEMIKHQLNEAKFKGVKVTYSNGDHITTSVNPNVTDEEIKQYFKVGRKANIGNGEHDKIVTIKSVEILPEEEF